VNLPAEAFISEATDTVDLGPCACPGGVHGSDTAEVRQELPWDVLTAIGFAASGVDGYRTLVEGALVSWSLLDDAGAPIPITRTTIRRLRPERMTPIAEAVNAVYARAQEPLPNGRSALSARSQPESAPSSPTIPTLGRRGRSR